MYKSNEINYLNAAILTPDNFRCYRPVFDELSFDDLPEELLKHFKYVMDDSDEYYISRNNKHYDRFRALYFYNAIEFSTSGINSKRVSMVGTTYREAPLPKTGILSTVTFDDFDNQIIENYELLREKTSNIKSAKLGKYPVADLLKYSYCALYNPYIWVYMKQLEQIESYRLAKFISEFADIYEIDDGKVTFIFEGNRYQMSEKLANYEFTNGFTFGLDNVFLSMPKDK